MRPSLLWSRAVIGALVKKSSTGKPECGALVCPNAGNTLKQPLDGQGSGLATFDNSLDDIGRQIAKPQNPADMGVAHSLTPCADFRILAARAAAEHTLPNPFGHSLALVAADEGEI